MNEYEINLIYDTPIEVDGLLLYPITLEKYMEFMLCVGCLLLDKNSIPSVEIISMNYLEYLIHIHKNGNESFSTMLDYLLRLVLHKLESRIEFGIDSNNRGFFSIDGVMYNGVTFDHLRKMICIQNSIDLPDENIQKEIRDKADEARRLRSKLSNSKPAKFEDQMVCVLVATGMSMEEVHKLTIRRFTKILERVNAKQQYEIFLAASINGMTKFKDTSFIKHWMTDFDDVDKNRDVFIGMDTITNKVSLEDKKIKQ